MQFTLSGFSQAEAVRLGLSGDDLYLLRWFVNFKNSGKMVFKIINGEKYYWVSYEKLVEELPLIVSKKDTAYRKFKKMVEAGVLDRKTVKQGGTFSFFKAGPNFDCLLKRTDNNPNDATNYPTVPDFSPNEATNSEFDPFYADFSPNQTDFYSEQKINIPDQNTIQKPRAHAKKSDEFLLAETLINRIQSRFPHIKTPNLDRWASVFAYMLNVEGRTVKEIKGLINWIYKPDNFWCSRILNPDQLKKHYDRLLATKIHEQTSRYLSNDPLAYLYINEPIDYELLGFELV